MSTRTAANNEATPCLAFAYLSAYVAKHGYRCVVIDGIAEALNRVWPLPGRPDFHCHGLTFDEIVARIPADAEVIGFSLMFSGEWPVQRRLIEKARERFPDALFVVGGEHATALTEYTLRDCPAIDVCARGEGEHTFLEILETYREDGDFGRVNGVAYLDGRGDYAEVGGLPRIRAVDAIPWPAWPDGYLEKFWAAGKSYGVQTERDMPIMASRGCPYRCTFCSSPQMWTTRYTLRSVDDLVAEIKHYIARYGITALQFYDLTAIVKKSWTVEFCERLLREGIALKWSLPSGTRSEALDGEVLALLGRTGCNYLAYAPESGSPATLERIKKRIDLGRLTRSVREAKRRGIGVRTNLIIGFPHETRADAFKTLRYGVSLALLGADEVTINIFSAYPGTEIFAQLRARGEIRLDDDYFMSLTSINSDYLLLDPVSRNPVMGSRELALYRLGFMLLNYAISYLLYPTRIARTLRNVLFSGTASSTVLEHRLSDILKRRRVMRCS